MKVKRNKKGDPKLYYRQYYNAYYCAQYRGIDWEFTYDEWVKWWGPDINNRGTYIGQLVMARYNDTGPYNVNNVKKIKSSENVSEGNTGKILSPEHLTKLSIGREKAYAKKRLIKEQILEQELEQELEQAKELDNDNEK
jgi:hypothetical protein